MTRFTIVVLPALSSPLDPQLQLGSYRFSHAGLNARDLQHQYPHLFILQTSFP